MEILRNVITRTAVSVCLLFTLSACDTLFPDERVAGTIPVHLKHVDTSTCPMTMKINNTDWIVDYFGLYVSNPEVRIDGKWQAVSFTQNEWQTAKVALLKYHPSCGGDKAGNTKLKINASEKLMQLATNLRFMVGLPFDENHANPLTQPSPLNDSTMFWSWQAGHKFIRLDIHNSQQPSQTWSYHLGSVGCESESAMRPPEKACKFTNRVEMILPMTQLDWELDLSLSVPVMLSQVDLTQSEGCMFESPENPVCGQLLKNLLHRPWLDWQ
ncbi:MbnP family copper-binding protein [Alteromonas antoniana]|uniref:MbnP family copper-binding protein n=1 Tax=Alteromonas antoniana TaxID=2803813 RepID=UPI003084195C